MTEPRAPRPGDDAHVPDTVLDELSAAFAPGDDPVEYNFDDPSIDRLLGLGPADPPPSEDPEAAPVAAAEPLADVVPITRAPAVQEAAGRDPEPAPKAGALSAAAPTAAAEEPAPARRTIVIADDGQPDTVYLDEEKEDRLRAVHGGDDSGSRSTIVISDLDDGVVEQAPTKTSSGIDPRIRARRIAVRRSEGRRRLLWFAVAGAAVVLLVGAVAVLASPIFDVEHVVVEGAVYTDQDVLDDVIAELEGEPVLLVDTEAFEARLEAVAWVERARVRTDFPHTVVIDIRERQPLATFQGGDGQWRAIDIDGRALDVIAGRPLALMLITGVHPDTARGQFAGAPYAAAALLVRSLPAEVRVLTESVGLDPATGTMTLQLAGGVEVRLGDADDLDQKLVRLLDQVRKGLDGVAALDVSTAEIGVVRQ